MKSEDEIQRAHDLLAAILIAEEVTDQVCDPGSIPLMIAATDVLCWVLGHEHNTKFAKNLRMLETRLNALGIVLIPMPEMVYPEGNG